MEPKILHLVLQLNNVSVSSSQFQVPVQVQGEEELPQLRPQQPLLAPALCRSKQEPEGESQQRSSLIYFEFLDTFTIIAAKKIAGYKKSKTADLSQKIEAGSHQHLKDEGSGSQELDIDTLFDDQTKTPRRKSSFIEHISSLLKSIL